MSNQTSIPNDTPVLLGTNNPDKQEVLRWTLDGLALAPKTPSQLGLLVEPSEVGETHRAIATAKAIDWSNSGSMLAIASDGGLLVPALGPNWESRYTHRFAGPDADNAQRVERLMELMQPYKGGQREATWIESLAIADRGELLASWDIQGATGIVAEHPSGVPQLLGFWVFSLWYFPELGKTYDQLSLEERRELNDHWAALRGQVQSFFRSHLRLPM